MVMARAARLPRRPSSRARSSPAARLVKVTAVSSEGLAPRSSTSQATRSTRVWVLPVPGPASTAWVYIQHLVDKNKTKCFLPFDKIG